ncbi:cyanophycinase [Candidatus Uabimicrobium amorphum]|uniref:Cyanophycinase n=1 Tax=Uabimicrobium amorphum TaxID=2596890 RepID=A0A5S9IT14_UABAM|nr:cyanophycinase [Candidatus Uabimicrobium amorphum]BBM86891.1 cyanophycinase [Candidatus Uabimicrobium amorphum]
MKLFLFLITTLSFCFAQEKMEEKPQEVKLVNFAKSRVKILIAGNPEDVTTETSYGLWLSGGGAEPLGRNEWFRKKSGGGDYVFLTASNKRSVSLKKGFDSTQTLVVDSREKAQSDYVYKILRNAEALYIGGGKQSRYFRYWKDTKVEKAIEYLATEKKIPIGGISAGLAILGQFSYTAAKGHPHKDFLNVPFMQNTITDTHFSNRKREKRLVGFLAKIVHRGWVESAKKVIGIGINEATALVVGENGVAVVYGKKKKQGKYPSEVYVVIPLTEPVFQDSEKQFSWEDPQAIQVWKLKPGDTIDLKTYTPREKQVIYYRFVNNQLLIEKT